MDPGAAGFVCTGCGRAPWRKRAGAGSAAGRPPWDFAALALGVAGLGAIGYFQRDEDTPLEVRRNFYGVVSVYDVDASDPAMHHFSLAHGIVVHGRQFVAPEKRRQAVAYYAPTTGVGRTLSYFQDRPDLRIGAVGLGVGTIAAYAGAGQSIRFYEINEQVQALAEKYFSYLKDSAGRTEIVLGDARLSLEREPAQGFHVFVLDAFSAMPCPRIC